MREDNFEPVISGGERKEKEIESFLKPFRELAGCRVFESHGEVSPWIIAVEWSEPEMRDGVPDLGPRHKFTAQGPLDQLFFNWAKKLFEYWIDKAAIGLRIQKIEYDPEGKIQRSW
ncbi:hypothetical protein HYV91_02095 [Candidatus Wolfebacteria bacterium]|nr:hypothetical protein [Candidatus Wolfebacteria bacterium]